MKRVTSKELNETAARYERDVLAGGNEFAENTSHENDFWQGAQWMECKMTPQRPEDFKGWLRQFFTTGAVLRLFAVGCVGFVLHSAQMYFMKNESISIAYRVGGAVLIAGFWTVFIVKFKIREH